jgi:hypothetical protein
MPRKGRHKGRAGHYCWSCDCTLPNERFSGKGHARHVCRECSKLGTTELARRQAIRNLERCLTYDGKLRRRARKQFQQFLDHVDPVVRQTAEDVLSCREATFSNQDRALSHECDGDDLIGVWIENDSCNDEYFPT